MVKESGRSLADLTSFIQRLPQTLINVGGVDRAAASTNEAVAEAVAAAEARLGDTGRVLLRPSGTEPLVRVMVEAATQEEADSVAASLADVVKENLAYVFDVRGRLPSSCVERAAGGLASLSEEAFRSWRPRSTQAGCG